MRSHGPAQRAVDSEEAHDTAEEWASLVAEAAGVARAEDDDEFNYDEIHREAYSEARHYIRQHFWVIDGDRW